MKTWIFVAVLICLCGCNAEECPEGLQHVNCFQAPCAAPAPANCAFASCVDDYCGGCNRHYFDAAGVEVCNECPDPTLCNNMRPQLVKMCPDGTQRVYRCLTSRGGGCAWSISPDCPEPICPDMMCMIYCETGYETDDNGCRICKCKE